VDSIHHLESIIHHPSPAASLPHFHFSPRYRNHNEDRTRRNLMSPKTSILQASAVSPHHGEVTLIAAAAAFAVGAVAIGAMAIGRLAIRRIVINSAEFESLKMQDLTVARLNVAELTVSDSLKLPAGTIDFPKRTKPQPLREKAAQKPSVKTIS
jgi:hypothetical protein